MDAMLHDVVHGVDPVRARELAQLGQLLGGAAL
jgi:hypothetical protein